MVRNAMLKLEMRENALILAGVLVAALVFAIGSFSGGGAGDGFAVGDLAKTEQGKLPKPPDNPDWSTSTGPNPYSSNPYDSYTASGQP
jgi:hypothetical protein